MDLFPSRVSHQFSQYISWKIDLFHQGRDDFQISWANKFVHAFPPFALIGRVLQNVNQDWRLIVIVTSPWPRQPWFQGLLTKSIKNPLLLAALKGLLKDLLGKLNALAMHNLLRLVTWRISERINFPKEYQNIFNQALRISLEEVVWLSF